MDILGIEGNDFKGKANAINTMFASVPDVLEPLDYFKLPAFLPVRKPVSHLYPWDVYAELRKLKPAVFESFEILKVFPSNFDERFRITLITSTKIHDHRFGFH